MDTIGIEFLSQIQEGQLYKYTNVVKGWQHRWFILDPIKGTLSYYLVNIMYYSYLVETFIILHLVKHILKIKCLCNKNYVCFILKQIT